MAAEPVIKISNVNKHNILVAAITHSKPWQWQVVGEYSWKDPKAFDAHAHPLHGSLVHSVVQLERRDGSRAQIEFDANDHYFVNAGDKHWADAKENDLYMRAVEEDFESAQLALLLTQRARQMERPAARPRP